MTDNRVWLGETEVELLYFLWKWKVSTTAALTARFYPKLAPITSYKKLWRLENGGYIEARNEFRSLRCIWVLSQRGYMVIRDSLPGLRENGFRSEHIGHDLVTAAVHLGRFLLDCPPEVGMVSEQELRRLPLELYPDWIPRTDDHRADGYWRVPIGNPMATVGLEVELSQKKDTQYQLAARFYKDFPVVVRVLWVVPTPAQSKLLHEKITSDVSGADIVHDFVSYSNFVRHGWSAAIEYGPERGHPISYLLGNNIEIPQKPVSENFLLDTRKCPDVSRAYRGFDARDFRY